MTAAERLVRVLRRPIPASLRRRIRLFLFRWLDLSWTLPSGIRLRVSSYGDWVIYNEIFVSGEYDQALRLAFEGRSGDGAALQILDLGANVGFFTLRAFDFARRLAPERRLAITAVESDSGTIDQLRARVLGENGLGAEVRPIHGAVGARSGAATLYALDRDHAHDTVHESPGSSSVQVPFVDLGPLFESIATLDLLKCDVEGAELSFVTHYPDLLAKVRVAVFELHDHLCDTAECARLLRTAGFAHEAVLRVTPPTSILCVWR